MFSASTSGLYTQLLVVHVCIFNRMSCDSAVALFLAMLPVHSCFWPVHHASMRVCHYDPFISTLYALFWTQASWSHTAWLMKSAKCPSCLIMDCKLAVCCINCCQELFGMGEEQPGCAVWLSIWKPDQGCNMNLLTGVTASLMTKFKMNP